MPERTYTTGEVAKVLQVAPRTVLKWLDHGKLRGHRESAHHPWCIPHRELVRFCREVGLEPPADEPAEEVIDDTA